MSRIIIFEKFLLTWSILLGISLTLLAMPPNGSMNFAFDEVFAQNQTVANQTTGAAAGQNQTVANVTRQEFQPLEDALTEARTAVQENNTGITYRALSSAQNEIFDLTHVSQGEAQGQSEVAKAKALGEQLKPVMDSIDKAKETIWNDDLGSSLNAVGSGQVSLLQITRSLPSGEGEGE
jgi:hypothetical protein